MIGIGILGYGTVGSGVFEVIRTNNDIIAHKAGEKIEVLKVLDLMEFPKDPVENILTHSFDDILKDESIQVVAEVMGGVEPAFTFTKQALMAGKSVVTSNKALVAEHGGKLLALAKANSVSYLFEASVGGTIPIIRPLTTSFTAEEILEVSGILNGTTNYILSKMASEGKAFTDVLKTAQELGYAEADPTTDVEGHDACRKIAILSSLAYGKTVDYKEIYTEGITKITAEDIEYAKILNGVLKLIATSKKTEKGISAKVTPLMIGLDHPLSTVNDAYNAIFVKGNMCGSTMFYGSGAGKLPTASAVVGDIVDAVRSKGKTVAIDWDTKASIKVDDLCDVAASALIRVAYTDKEDAKAACKKIFADAELINFVENETLKDELGVVVMGTTEELLTINKEKVKNEKGVKEVRNLIRMEA